MFSHGSVKEYVQIFADNNLDSDLRGVYFIFLQYENVSSINLKFICLISFHVFITMYLDDCYNLCLMYCIWVLIL